MRVTSRCDGVNRLQWGNHVVEEAPSQLAQIDLTVKPSAGLAPELRMRVESTVQRLKLNDSECLAA